MGMTWRAKKLMVITFVFLLVSLLLISITSCVNNDPVSAFSDSHKVIEPNEIIIGGLFHLTGPGAMWGTGEMEGAALAVEILNKKGGINGRDLRIVSEDGGTDFAKTASSINKLIDIGRVSIIIGPTWFGQVAAPIVMERKIIMVSPSAGVVPQPNPYFFDLWPTEAQEIEPEVEYMRHHGVSRLAIVYSQNDWSESMKNNFLNESSRTGISIVKEFATSSDETDFRTVITNLNLLNIDAVYAPFAFYPSQGAFSKQAREMGLPFPIFSSSGTENPQLVQSFPSIEGTIYPYRKRTNDEIDFENRFQKRFGHPPSPSSAYGYDAVMVLSEAIKSGAATSDQISVFLHAMRGYQGVSNTITFDSNGRITAKDHIMKQVSHGAFVSLS